MDSSPPQMSMAHSASVPEPLSQDNEIAIPPESLAEERSQWLSQVTNDNLQLFALRERVLPWTGGHSFANLVHTDTTAILPHVNRYSILELVYQHLCAIGMYNTAETLQEESQLKFQHSKQPWDKTTLMLLVSLGILPHENPWNIAPDPHHHFVDENLEEDFFASPYRDSKMCEIYKELQNPNINAIYNENSGRKQTLNTLIRGSLNRLVVLVTTTGDQHALQDMTRFFLSLHAITSSEHFLEHLITLFDLNYEEHPNLPYGQSQLRLMIVNLIKKWVNEHGKFIGNKTIKAIGRFLRRVMEDPACQNVYKYTQTVLTYLPDIQYGPKNQRTPTATEQPIISNYQILFQPNLKLIDPDPTEVARQITLLFHNAFKVVHSREFIIASRIQGISHQTPTLSEFFDFGKKLTLLAFETITQAQDMGNAITRTLQIAEALDKLNNFHALACIIQALQQKVIMLHPVMQNPANKEKYEHLYNRSGENPKTLQDYSEKVKALFDECLPAIPNLMTEFHMSTSNTNSTENSKSSPTIDNDGLINWEMIWANSYKALVYYWFQFKCKPYLFYAIPQIQDLINRGPTLTKEQLKWDDDFSDAQYTNNPMRLPKPMARHRTRFSFDNTGQDQRKFAASYS
ncbi:RasGEF domain containing protein [Tritrichomonas foetus]|uniref:RasGEF domain containing protein n=1 Tax=Tritrichomonas foetus TaxID=1144522 RepID=A0A1J4J708_9EUKA|nr:RasGEF domain containing protein [Tritrichomonas foetus]|eukprot:OHS95014.1 RasGEF domain containing protein [Tritrichomonas foetus]